MAQAEAGLVGGDQTGGAGGVDGEHGACKVEEVGQPGGEHGIVVGSHPALAARNPLVVPLVSTDEDADFLGLNSRLALTGVLQTVPGFLEQETLARVHDLGFDWGDLKEQRIKLADPWNAPA